MMRGMSAAISGLEVHQTMLDTTANNLANVDTVAYKAQRTTFMDELSQTLRGSVGPAGNNGGQNALQVGLGTQVGSIDNIMTEGSFQNTGNPLDVAIQGEGFFTIQPNTGTVLQYTRAGNFTLNSNGDLTTASGQYVLDTTGAKINVPPGSSSISIGQNGTVNYIDSTGAAKTAGPIAVVTFPNAAGLVRDGASLWSATPNSGPASAPTAPGTNGAGVTIGGTLETSNVDLATEFSNMITAQRGYQANSRVITTADQMLQTVVQMGQ